MADKGNRTQPDDAGRAADRPPPAMFGAYAPQEIAQGIEDVGLAKAKGALLPTLALAFLAGAYIALGAMFYILTMTGADAGFGPARPLGGVASKILAIVFSISAFVALGFEHSIANMFFLPYATLLSFDPALAAKGVSMAGLVHNLAAVTLGNIGGGVFVALSYYVIYLRGRR